MPRDATPRRRELILPDKDLRQHLLILRRHVRLIGLCVVVSLGMTFLRLNSAPELYHSATKFLLESKGEVRGSRSRYYSPPAVINPDVIREMLLSTPVETKTRALLKLPEGSTLGGRFEVRFPRRTTYGSNQILVTLAVISREPERAYNLVNATVQAFREQLMDNQLQKARESLTWLAERLAEQKDKVEEGERQFQEFKQEIMVLTMDEQQQSESRKIYRTQETATSVAAERLQLEIQLDKLQRAVSQGMTEADLVFRSYGESSVRRLLTELEDLDATRASKAQIFRAKHPEMRAILRQIEEIRGRIEEEKQRTMATLEIQINTARDREAALSSSVDTLKREAQRMGAEEVEYRILERNVQMDRDLYSALMGELEGTSIRGKIEATSVVVIEPPSIPRAPMGKGFRRKVVLGLLMGFLIGIGLSYGREYLDSVFRTPEDVEKVLGVQVVGMIPEGGQAQNR